MIKNLILDIDGVINGSISGVNTPYPSTQVVKALQSFLKDDGLLVFCTSKAVYPVIETVKKFKLHGIHIADAGGVIYDSKEKTYQLKSFDEESAKQVIEKLEATGNYFEIYTDKDWYILEQFADNIYSKNHTDLLLMKPKYLKTASNFRKFNKVTKIIYFSDDDTNTETNMKLMASLNDHSTKWTHSPVLKPANLMIITPKGISKKDAVLEISKKYNFSLTESLAVGDHHSDWQFMEICQYKGVMSNSTPELINIGNSQSPETTVIGGHVDNDGLLIILEKFNLLK